MSDQAEYVDDDDPGGDEIDPDVALMIGANPNVVPPDQDNGAEPCIPSEAEEES